MTDFLSIADAAELTGRHEKTIRRWIKKQFDTDPKAKEKIVQEKTVSGFTYRIDKDYLLAHSPTPVDSPPIQSAGHPPGRGADQDTRRHTSIDPVISAKDETIALLKDQIIQQQEELRRKNEQLKTVLERLGEQNVLLRGYQERYLLTAPRPREGFDITVDNPAGQGAEQGAVHPHGQDRRANPTDLDTKEGQNEQAEKQNEAKPTRKLVFKKSKSPKKSGQEQPKKKGFFSFLRRK